MLLTRCHRFEFLYALTAGGLESGDSIADEEGTVNGGCSRSYHSPAVSLIRRNRRRTILTILAVACATLVFCTVMVLPYVTERIVAIADSSPRLVVMNKSAMRYGLPESYSQKIANDSRRRRGEPDDLVRRCLRRSQASVLRASPSIPKPLAQMWPEDGFDPRTVSRVQGISQRRDGRCRHACIASAGRSGRTSSSEARSIRSRCSFTILGSYSGGSDPTRLHVPARLPRRGAARRDAGRHDVGAMREFAGRRAASRVKSIPPSATPAPRPRPTPKKSSSPPSWFAFNRSATSCRRSDCAPYSPSRWRCSTDSR